MTVNKVFVAALLLSACEPNVGAGGDLPVEPGPTTFAWLCENTDGSPLNEPYTEFSLPVAAERLEAAPGGLWRLMRDDFPGEPFDVFRSDARILVDGVETEATFVDSAFGDQAIVRAPLNPGSHLVVIQRDLCGSGSPCESLVTAEVLPAARPFELVSARPVSWDLSTDGACAVSCFDGEQRSLRGFVVELEWIGGPLVADGTTGRGGLLFPRTATPQTATLPLSGLVTSAPARDEVLRFRNPDTLEAVEFTVSLPAIEAPLLPPSSSDCTCGDFCDEP